MRTSPPPRFLFLPLLSFLLCAATVRAQHAFTLSIPDIVPSSERSVVQASDGGFVLLFNRNIGLTETGRNDTTLLGLAKLSPDGLIEWSRSIDIDAPIVQGVSLLPTPDGGFIAVARTMEFRKREEREQMETDIALLRFNAHGYLLWARRYAAGTITDPQDALFLDNGNLLICTVISDGVDAGRPEAALIVVDMAGEVVWSNRYPALGGEWSTISALRSLEGGNIALLGSLYDTATSFHAGMVAILNPDGTPREGILFDPNSVIYTENLTIADILPNKQGGYTLLTYSGWYGCGGPSYFGLMAECDRDWKPLWIAEQNIDIDASTLSDRFIPTEEKGFRIIGQATSREGSPRYLIQDLNEYGREKSALQTAPFPVEISQELAGDVFENMQSHYYPTGDRGMLILGMKKHTTYDEEYIPTEETDTTFITRLSFDFASCSGNPELLTIGDEGERLSEETIETEEEKSAAEASAEEPSVPEVNPAIVPLETDGEVSESLGEKEPPIIKKLDVIPMPITFTQRSAAGHRTVDISLKENIICQESPSVLTSVHRNGEGPEPNTSATILLSPNALRAGEGSMITFALSGTEKPDITLLTVATGGVVRHLESNAVTWSPATAQGSAWLQTDGLAAGVYLVRVRSGERQLTAKLEVR